MSKTYIYEIKCNCLNKLISFFFTLHFNASDIQQEKKRRNYISLRILIEIQNNVVQSGRMHKQLKSNEAVMPLKWFRVELCLCLKNYFVDD